MAKLPPTIESPRSSFRPAMAPRFSSRREAPDLHAAPADVEEGPVRHGQASHGSEEAVAGFFGTRENTDFDPEVGADPADEPRSVARVAPGGGGHRHRPLRPRAAGHGHEVPEGHEQALFGLGRQLPVFIQLAHQP